MTERADQEDFVLRFLRSGHESCAGIKGHFHEMWKAWQAAGLGDDSYGLTHAIERLRARGFVDFDHDCLDGSSGVGWYIREPRK
jgi:hypothetical protein